MVLTRATHACKAIGTGTWLVWNGLRGFARMMWTRDPLAEAGLGEAMARFVWGPVVTLIGLALLTGVIAGVAAGQVLQVYNVPLLIIAALADALMRQILPLVVGVFASGSVSVELASRLGAMSLAREVDALEAMGHDPVPRLLGPPIVAVLLASPVHMLIAALSALLGASVALHLGTNLAYHTFTQIALTGQTGHALLIGMGKALLFATIALMVGAAVGARPVRVPSQIGRHAGSAFTTGLLAIFAAASLWAVLA